MASNTIFIAFGILNKYLEKTTLIKSTSAPRSYKTSLDKSPSKSLSMHSKKVKSTKLKTSWMSNRQVCWPACTLIFISNFFSNAVGVFRIRPHRPHLNFKIVDENNDEVILRTFYLQLLNKE